jgi:hypothetical protein
MAGCRPEHMPILVAIAEAMCDPAWEIEHAGSTPGWEPLVVLSGSLVKRLGFNSGPGVMRVGNRANTSIGRFGRLFMRNVGGLRPGFADKGTIATTFNVVLAEDEEATDRLGWPPFRVDQGYLADDNLVTVQSVFAISPPIYSGGDTGLQRIETITHYMGSTCGPWVFLGIVYTSWYPLLLMSPAVAKAFAEDGWSKADIRRHLYDNLRLPAREIEHYPLHSTGAEISLAELVREGIAAPHYAESDDPDRLVPQLVREEWTNIVVAGDPGMNQSRIYVNNHGQGRPVSKRVVLPHNWGELLEGAEA